MRDNRVFPEKALHVWGELRQTILVSHMHIVRSFAHFSSYATAFLLAITIMIGCWHIFIAIIYVVLGRESRDWTIGNERDEERAELQR